MSFDNGNQVCAILSYIVYGDYKYPMEHMPNDGS
jgi:hypothetical protein